MKVTKEDIKRVFDLSDSDLKRLLECITCQNNPYTCGCTESDEDEKGHCQKYKCREGIVI